ncbi:MAG: lantibiotic immunity ABC transporter MutG family permease subunit [Roseburia sp.]
MTNYIHYLKSDLYKLRHSCFFLLHLIFPVCGAAMLLLYAGISKSNEISKLAAYFQMIAVAFPFVIGVICHVVSEQEAKAGHFQNLLTLPDRRKTILSKLAILLLSGLFSTVLSSILFGFLFPAIGGAITIPIGFYTVVPLVLWGSNILLYCLHLMLAFRFGKNVGIGFGVFGSLLVALLQTGLGTGIWFVLPYGWGVRFSALALESILGILSPERAGINLGIISCSLSTCVIIGIIIVWFSRYDGKHATD